MSSQQKKTPPACQSMSIVKAFSMSVNKRKRKAVESEIDQQEVSAAKRISEDKAEVTEGIKTPTKVSEFVPNCTSSAKKVCDNVVEKEDIHFLNDAGSNVKKSEDFNPNSNNKHIQMSKNVDSEVFNSTGVNSDSEENAKFLIPVILVESDNEVGQLSSSALSSSFLNTTNAYSSSENKDLDENASTSSMQTSHADSFTVRKKRNHVSGDEVKPNGENCLTVKSIPQRKKKKMSPEEALKKTELRLQKEKEKAQKEKEKMERMAQLSAKKEELRQLKISKELEKAERERLKKEKKDQEEKEKQQRLEEKERRIKLKQQLLEAKEEQKKLKEQQRLKAQEDRQKMEEEKKKLEMEKELKKSKTKSAFENFFLKSGFTISPPQATKREITFKPFQVADDMVLAPIVPLEALKRLDKEKLDELLVTQDASKLYIELLKSGKYERLKSVPSKKSKSTEDVEVVNDIKDADLKLRAKLLQFCDNIRPAYWGTWQKQSKNIRPRNPFGQVDYLDYDVDSDEEWDEGGPGESLTGTEDEESEDDYEVDNEFFVPHGYLSAEEEGDDENDGPTDPEELRQRLKLKEEEFLSKRKQKTTTLKPEILGCFFQADDNCNNVLIEKSLIQYSTEVLTSVIDLIKLTNKVKMNKVSNADDQTRCVPQEAMPYLIELIHANTNSFSTVASEFQEFWTASNIQHGSDLELNDEDSSVSALTDHLDNNEVKGVKAASDKNKISKRQLKITVRDIATWGRSPDPKLNKFCWWVKESVLKKYGLADLPVPNQWKYVLTPQNKESQNTVKPPLSSTRKSLVFTNN